MPAPLVVNLFRHCAGPQPTLWMCPEGFPIEIATVVKLLSVRLSPHLSHHRSQFDIAPKGALDAHYVPYLFLEVVCSHVKSSMQVIAPTDEVIDKIRSFITLKLPVGFPIKFELPVYPTVAVRCHFADVKMKIEPGKRPLMIAGHSWHG